MKKINTKYREYGYWAVLLTVRRTVSKCLSIERLLFAQITRQGILWSNTFLLEPYCSYFIYALLNFTVTRPRHKDTRQNGDIWMIKFVRVPIGTYWAFIYRAIKHYSEHNTCAVRTAFPYGALAPLQWRCLMMALTLDWYNFVLLWPIYNHYHMYI